MSACVTESLMVTLNPRVLRVAAPTLHPIITHAATVSEEGAFRLPCRRANGLLGLDVLKCEHCC